MQLKWIGAAMILAGCGGWGCLLASGYQRQEKLLRRLAAILRSMRWELRYRLTAMPDLCRLASKDASGELRLLFQDLAREMDHHRQPDAERCMLSVLSRHDSLPPKIKRLLRQLGRILGRFDLEGQLEGLECVLRECETEQKDMKQDLQIRLKSSRTLALCAGVALVILFV